MALVAPRTIASTHEIDPREVIPALLDIAAKWGFDDRTTMRLLGIEASRTLQQWRAHPPSSLSSERLERLSYIAWIYELLHALFADDRVADDWPNRPNTAPLFAGHPPHELMCSGSLADIFRVYEHLFAQTQGWS